MSEQPQVPEQVTGEAFGFPSAVQAQELEGVFDDPAPEVTEEATATPGETPQPEAPAEQPAGEATEEPQPFDLKSELQGQAPKPEEGKEGELLFGKWRTPEDLYESYRQIQSAADRRQAVLQAEELKRQEAEARAQQLEEALRQVALRLQAEQGAPEALQQLQQVQSQQGLEEKVRQQVLEEQQRQEAQRLGQQVEREVESFRLAYPDSRAYENEIAANILKFQDDGEGGQEHSLFPVTRENLEIAYVLAKNPKLSAMVDNLDLIPTEENLKLAHEAVQNPHFAKVLMANPQVLQRDDDVGIQWAREQAQLPQLVQVGQAQSQAQDAQRRNAYVETGGTGAPVQPAPGQKPGDEFDEAIAAYKSNSFGDNVFGL